MMYVVNHWYKTSFIFCLTIRCHFESPHPPVRFHLEIMLLFPTVVDISLLTLWFVQFACSTSIDCNYVGSGDVSYSTGPNSYSDEHWWVARPISVCDSSYDSDHQCFRPISTQWETHQKRAIFCPSKKLFVGLHYQQL